MTNHLKSSVDSFVNELNILKTDCILEIGANDGVCVKHLLANGFVNIIGIDPASNINKRHNLPIICDFFGSNVLNHFQERYTPFKLIYSFHCCAHIENIQDVFETIYKLLDENGTFVMEV
jgi:2-polyprenyl-3-methyl-5-hydroxy-6-metoxy-1,4-benzoquinol methylase